MSHQDGTSIRASGRSERPGPGLVLTRRVGERIMIGDDIEIEVREIDEGQVKLAIVAPRDVPVDRLEIWVNKIRERAGQMPRRRT